MGSSNHLDFGTRNWILCFPLLDSSRSRVMPVCGYMRRMGLVLKQQGDLGTQWGFKMFYYTTEGCTYLGTQWGFKIGTLRVSPSRLYGLWYKQDNTGLRARQSLASGQPHYK